MAKTEPRMIVFSTEERELKKSEKKTPLTQKSGGGCLGPKML